MSNKRVLRGPLIGVARIKRSWPRESTQRARLSIVLVGRRNRNLDVKFASD